VLLAGVVVFWIMSRADHRLADAVPGYRLVRHVVRLILIGTFFAVTSLHEFEHGFWPQSAAEVRVLFGDPRFFVSLGIAVVVAHWLLRRANTIRDKWHAWLEVFRLRPSA
jgi:hypothetical protein